MATRLADQEKELVSRAHELDDKAVSDEVSELSAYELARRRRDLLYPPGGRVIDLMVVLIALIGVVFLAYVISLLVGEPTARPWTETFWTLLGLALAEILIVSLSLLARSYGSIRQNEGLRRSGSGLLALSENDLSKLKPLLRSPTGLTQLGEAQRFHARRALTFAVQASRRFGRPVASCDGCIASAELAFLLCSQDRNALVTLDSSGSLRWPPSRRELNVRRRITVQRKIERFARLRRLDVHEQRLITPRHIVDGFAGAIRLGPSQAYMWAGWARAVELLPGPTDEVAADMSAVAYLRAHEILEANKDEGPGGVPSSIDRLLMDLFHPQHELTLRRIIRRTGGLSTQSSEAIMDLIFRLGHKQADVRQTAALLYQQLRDRTDSRQYIETYAAMCDQHPAILAVGRLLSSPRSGIKLRASCDQLDIKMAARRGELRGILKMWPPDHADGGVDFMKPVNINVEHAGGTAIAIHVTVTARLRLFEDSYSTGLVAYFACPYSGQTDDPLAPGRNANVICPRVREVESVLPADILGDDTEFIGVRWTTSDAKSGWWAFVPDLECEFGSDVAAADLN